MSTEENACRICRCEGTPDDPLFHPCKCRGSIKYIHQDCLTSWLEHSKKNACDICHEPYTFKTLYDENTPEKLPVKLIIQKILFQLYDLVYKAVIGISTILFVVVQIPFFVKFTARVYTWLLGCPIPHASVWESLLYGDNDPLDITSNTAAPNNDNQSENPPMSWYKNRHLLLIVQQTYFDGWKILIVTALFIAFSVAIHEWIVKDEGFAKIIRKRIGPEARLKNLYRILENAGQLPPNLPAQVAPQPPPQHQPQAQAPQPARGPAFPLFNHNGFADIINSDDDEDDEDYVDEYHEDLEEENETTTSMDDPEDENNDDLSSEETVANTGSGLRRRENRNQQQNNIERLQNEQHQLVNDVNNYLNAIPNDVRQNTERFNGPLLNDFDDNVDENEEHDNNNNDNINNLNRPPRDPTLNAAQIEILGGLLRNGLEQEGVEEDGDLPIRRVPIPQQQQQQEQQQQPLAEQAQRDANANALLEFSLNPMLPVKVAAIADLVVVAVLGSFYFLPSLLGMFSFNIVTGIILTSYALYFNLAKAIGYLPTLDNLNFGYNYYNDFINSIDDPNFIKYYDFILENVFNKVAMIYTNITQWSPKNDTTERSFVVTLGYSIIWFSILVLMKKMEKGCSSVNPLEGGYRLIYVFLLEIVSTFKVFAIFGIELYVFPVFCGYQLDFVLSPLGENLENELLVSSQLFSKGIPFCMFQLGIGTAFMYLFASFVSMARTDILRKGVLFFIRSPDDPNVRLIHDALMKPFRLQLSRISLSGFVYTGYIILEFGIVTWGIRYLSPVEILPLTQGCKTAVFVTVLVYDRLLKGSLSPAFKRLWKKVFEVACATTRLSSFVLGKDISNERGYVVYRNWFYKLASMFKNEDSNLTDKLHLVQASRTKQFFNEHPDTIACFVPDGNFIRAPDDDNVSRSFIKKLFVPVTKNDNLLAPIKEVPDNEERFNPYGDEEIVSITTYTIVYRPPHFKIRIFAFLGMLWASSILSAAFLYWGIFISGRISLMTFCKLIMNTEHCQKVNDAFYKMDHFTFIAGFVFCHTIIQKFDKYLTERESKVDLDLEVEDDNEPIEHHEEGEQPVHQHVGSEEQSDDDDINIEQQQPTTFDKLRYFIFTVILPPEVISLLRTISYVFVSTLVEIFTMSISAITHTVIIKAPFDNFYLYLMNKYPNELKLIDFAYVVSVNLSHVLAQVFAIKMYIRAFTIRSRFNVGEFKELITTIPDGILLVFMITVLSICVITLDCYFYSYSDIQKDLFSVSFDKLSFSIFDQYYLKAWKLPTLNLLILYVYCILQALTTFKEYIASINTALKDEYYKTGVLLTNNQEDEEETEEGAAVAADAEVVNQREDAVVVNW